MEIDFVNTQIANSKYMTMIVHRLPVYKETGSIVLLFECRTFSEVEAAPDNKRPAILTQLSVDVDINRQRFWNQVQQA